MDVAQALKLLRGGQDGIAEWNKHREEGEEIPDLKKLNLKKANLEGADLSEANLPGAYLGGADLSDSDLSKANLIGAYLRNAMLIKADLSSAYLSKANLRGANFQRANLSGANLSDADLHKATLWGANLRGANFQRANLSGANLSHAVIIDAFLEQANLSQAELGYTVLSSDLSNTTGLETIAHSGPSVLDANFLQSFRNELPRSFLQGCGLSPWMAKVTKIGLPHLKADEINDILYDVFDLRAKGPLFIGGVFISYSRTDAAVVDKLYGRLKEEGASVWLDRHDMVSGPLGKQIQRVIRLQDVFLLVLSESSVKSDWVEHELEMARMKEKEENRDVLCPVAIDDSWKTKMDDVLWRQLKKKNIIDFSEWRTNVFENQFAKLLKGLKIYYPSADSDSGSTA